MITRKQYLDKEAARQVKSEILDQCEVALVRNGEGGVGVVFLERESPRAFEDF